MNQDSSVIEVNHLVHKYGRTEAVNDLSLRVRRGQCYGFFGRNGAGKTTTLRSIIGILGKRNGSILFEGTETIRLPSRSIARLGMGYCPEERGIYASLSVEENLMLPPVVKPGGLPLERIYALFPNIKERRSSQGTKLSGGEQQMLAIGRILRTGARTLLIDEPTEGLAPVIVQQIGRTIRELKKEGFNIVLVEENFHFAATVADRHYVVEQGRVVDMISNAGLEANKQKLRTYLGI